MSFFAALQFLTIVPIRLNFGKKQLSNSMIFFPVVGLLLGFFLVGTDKVFNSNVIDVIMLIILTGALHLDGLGDTFDAMGKTKDKALEIMKDSHIGVFGVVAIISVILLKIELLSKLSCFKTAGLLLLPIISRWCMVQSIYMFKYARKTGKSSVFFEGINSGIFIYATIIALLCSFLIIGFMGPAMILLCFFASFIINRYFVSRIGGITGDTIGALGEFIELLTLGSVLAIEIFLPNCALYVSLLR